MTGRGIATAALLFGAVGLSAVPAQAGPALFIAGGECAGMADVSAFVARQQRRAREALAGQNVDLVVPRRADEAGVKQALKAMTGDARLVLYAGHARVDASGRSVVCLSGRETPIEELVRHATSGSNTPGAITFVFNACQSAAVDLSGIDVPVSVISASPYDVETDSAFAESTVQALADRKADVNCDGRVSDQELFDAIVEAPVLTRSLSFRPAVPKIRRQAAGDLPLPLRRQDTQACNERRAVVQLARSGRLPPPLAQHLQDPFSKQVLEAKDYLNYFLLDNLDSRADGDKLLGALTADFKPLSIGAAEAELVARHVTANNVYRFQLANGWVRILRLRDGRLLATRRLDDVRPALPSRLQDTGDVRFRRRFLGRVLALGSGFCAVPCTEEDGQCFSRDCRQ